MSYLNRPAPYERRVANEIIGNFEHFQVPHDAERAVADYERITGDPIPTPSRRVILALVAGRVADEYTRWVCLEAQDEQ